MPQRVEGKGKEEGEGKRERRDGGGGHLQKEAQLYSRPFGSELTQ